MSNSEGIFDRVFNLLVVSYMFVICVDVYGLIRILSLITVLLLHGLGLLLSRLHWICSQKRLI